MPVNKKVVFAIQDLGLGGTEKTVVMQANLLHERGYEVAVLTVAKNPKKDLAIFLRVPQYNFNFKSLYDVSELLRLLIFLRKYKPDTVISNLFFTNTIIKLAKIFYRDFNLFIREGNVFVKHSLKAKLFDRVTQYMARGYITNAAAIKKDMIEKIGIHPRKIKVIYNGVDPQSFREPAISREKKRKSLGIPEGAFVLLNVGSMNSEQKGQKYLLGALAKIPKEEKVIVVFVGDGQLRNKFTMYAQGLGVSGVTFFLGNRNDIKELRHASDMFVFPSIWEGMPNALLDAMASGMPIIATPVGGISEVIKDGESGIFVSPGDVSGLADAILRLKNDASLCKVLGNNATKAISDKKFTWEHHINQITKLVEANS